MKRSLLLLILALLTWVSGTPCLSQTAHPDTTYYLVFNLKMAKAIQEGIFNPSADSVYVVPDHGIAPILMTAGSQNTWSGYISSGLDSGAVYTYRYRINDTLFEDVTHSVEALPGTVSVTDWWNNDPLNVTTFNLDMTYMVAAGQFHPDSDSLDLVGTMNAGLGSPVLQQVGTSLVYTISMVLDPGTVYTYRFRINRDPFKTEFFAQQPRYFRAPDTVITLNLHYNDYDPATIPMTFRCNLTYMISQGLFDIDTDYLDAAGNFNNQGAYDLLYKKSADSIYSTTLFFDTAQTGMNLEFKYRINGNWATAELTDQPYRSYALHDTANGNPDNFYAWYNNIDPTVPAAPWVTDLFIQGSFTGGSTVTGIYSYHDLNGRPEGQSLYQWYLADTLNGPVTAIDTASKINYLIDSTALLGKYLVFQVTPVAQYGDSATGKPARVWGSYPIGGVGMEEKGLVRARCYPNPFTDRLMVDTQERALDMALTNPSGQLLLKIDNLPAGKHQVSTAMLPPGLYIIVLKSPEGYSRAFKLLHP